MAPTPMVGFNPRPPISQRATGLRPAPRGCARCFNPRPPISQRATPQVGDSPAVIEQFQSTPANFTAGDHPRGWRCRARRCFNPRPPISQRATAHDGRRLGVRGRFNPRPPISQRATAARRAASVSSTQFQSTPANFTAGDLGLGVIAHGVGVSIHARQFHSGRPARG